MSILKKFINIRIQALTKGVCFLSLLFLGGCTSAVPEEIMQLFIVQKANCWPCTGYRVVWEALGNLTQRAFPITCGLALNLLGIGLLFWIVFTVSKFLVALKEPNIKEFITSITTILFKALVVSAILITPANTMYILDLVVTPVVAIFVDLAHSVLFVDKSTAKYFAVPSSPKSVAATASAIFTADVGNQIQDVVYRVYLSFSSGIGLGARMLISTDILSWGLGLFIMFVFIYLMLVMPLLFMEGFLVLGIVLVAFPFFLVSYVFPSTKAMLKEAWHALFIAVAQILVTCIYVSVFVGVIKSYTNNFSIGKQLTDVMLLTGLKSMSSSALAFFALIWCLFKMANDVPRMTSFLVGTMNRSMMMQLVQRFTSLATSAGKFVAGAAMVATGVGSGMGTAMMKDSLRESAKTIRDDFATGSDGAGSAYKNRFEIGSGMAADPKK